MPVHFGVRPPKNHSRSGPIEVQTYRCVQRGSDWVSASINSFHLFLSRVTEELNQVYSIAIS